MIEITERDERFLKILGRAGACSAKIPKVIYPARFSRERMVKLERERYINRSYNLITLSIKGVEYLESINEKPKKVQNMPTYMQKRLATALDIEYALPEMTIIPSTKYKKMKRLNRGMQFIAVGQTQEEIDYLLYDISSNTTKETKNHIIKELRNKKNIIQHALIITSDKTFEKQLKVIGVPELLVLPRHDMFNALINEMAKGEFDKKVLSAAYPEIAESEVLENKSIKYEINSEVYINMVLNNISVFPYLKSINNLMMQTGSTTQQTYNIVCLEVQVQYIKRKIDELNLNKIDAHIEPLSIEKII